MITKPLFPVVQGRHSRLREYHPYTIQETQLSNQLAHLYMQGSSLFLMKPNVLMQLLNHLFQLRDACLSP